MTEPRLLLKWRLRMRHGSNGKGSQALTRSQPCETFQQNYFLNLKRIKQLRWFNTRSIERYHIYWYQCSGFLCKQSLVL